MFCQKCGKENPENTQFCSGCGNSFKNINSQEGQNPSTINNQENNQVNQAQANSVPNNQGLAQNNSNQNSAQTSQINNYPNQQAHSKRKGCLIAAAVAFGGLALIIIFFISFLSVGTRGVQDAAEGIIADFHQGNIEKVYQESLFPSEWTFQEFNQNMGVGSNYDITKAKKIKWTGKGIKNNEKYIYGEMEFPNKKVLTIVFVFMNQDGELKLMGIVEKKEGEY
jgi:uncharacterized membrane protein YvbJ